MISRAYVDADLSRLITFASAATARRWPMPAYWHPGDVVWRVFGRTDAAPSQNIRLWLDHDAVAGVAWFEMPDHVEFQTRQDAYAFLPEMLAWAQARAASAGASSIETAALVSDGARIATLADAGFVRDERHAVRMRRALAGAEAGALPGGFVLRHATDDDIEERVAAHRDGWSVWGPSGMTVETYRNLRAAPFYHESLDVIAEAPTGEIASCCICWMDAETGTGYFEPVSTRPAYAGRGLGKAVTMEGLRRLRERGAHTALVQTASMNARALRLYASCGFEVTEREHLYYGRANG